MTSDRDQASDSKEWDLRDIIALALVYDRDFSDGLSATKIRATVQRVHDAVLAHPDLVRRALGMEPRDAILGIPVRTSGEFTARVWVEPPTSEND